jgi:hypothetical protein
MNSLLRINYWTRACALIAFAAGFVTAAGGADVQVYKVSKGIYYRQLPGRWPTNLAQKGYAFQATVDLSAPGTVLDATVSPPKQFARTLQSVADDQLEFTQFVDLRSTLQTRYPDGAFTFAFDTQNDGPRAVPLRLAGAAYPAPPFIHDLIELQSVNANGFSVIAWEPFRDGTNVDLIHLRIEDASGNPALERRLDGTATFVIIRPGQLQPLTNYTATLLFEKFVSRDSTNYPGAVGLASYFSQTRFTIKTTAEDAPDVERYELSKGRRFEQEDTGEPDPDAEDFIFSAEVRAREPGLVTAASVITPLGSVFALAPDLEREEFEFSITASDELAIDALSPLGNYLFDWHTATDGNRLVGLWFDAGKYPPAPHLSFDPTAEVEPNVPFIISWDQWTNGSGEDFIQVRLEDEDGNVILESPDFDEPGALDGRATSFVVPAGTLRTRVDYEASVTFRRFNRLNWFDYPGALGVSSIYATTRFDIETTRPDLEEYNIARGRGFRQGRSGPPVPDSGDEFIFEAEVEASRTNAILSATLTTPRGVTVPLTPNNDGDEFEFSDRASTEAAFNAEYPPGDYRFDIVGQRGPLSVVLNAPDAPYPPAPDVHVSSLPDPEPGQPLTITWDPWPGATTNDFIQVRIQDDDTGDTVFETPNRGDPGALDGTATSVTIPGEVFEARRDYEGRVTFERIVRHDEATLPGAEGTVTYFSRTDFDIEAARPDVEDYRIERGRRYDQLTAAPPVPREGDEFVFNAEVQASAPNVITSATVTTPPGDVRTLQPNNRRDEWEYSDDRSTEAAFNSRYPPGRYVFTVQSVNDGTTTLPLDAPNVPYPPAPHLQSDPRTPVPANQPVVFQWDPWLGGTAEDFIQFRIEHVATGTNAFETPDRGEPGALNGLSTSVTVPAGTLVPGQSYEGRLVFERIVATDETTLPGAEGRVTYFARTDFPIQTAAGDVEDYRIERGRRFQQATSGLPVPDPGDEFVFNAEVQGTAPNSILFASLTTPPGATVVLAPNNDRDEFEFSDQASTQTEFDTEYPPGTYTFTVQTATQGTQTLPLAVPADEFPPAPHVLFDPSTEVSPHQPLNLNWDPWPGATTNDFIQVRIEDDDNNVLFETGDPGETNALNGLSTSVTIPGGTLIPGITHEGRVVFERIVVSDETTLPGAEGRVTYFARTDFDIRAVPADVQEYEVFKERVYSQTSNDTPVPTNFVFLATVEAEDDDTVTSASIVTPTGRTVPLAQTSGGDQFELEERRATQELLDADFPDGDYVLIINAVTDGFRQIPVALTNAVYPPPPQLSNYDAAQTIDANAPFTLTWLPFTGGTDEDHIDVQIEDTEGDEVFDTPGFGNDGALNGTATSVTVPPFTLQPGRTYEVRILFENNLRADDSGYRGVPGRVGYSARTFARIATAPVASRPLIANYQRLPDGRLQLTLGAAPGQACEIQGSPDLINWTPLATLSVTADLSTFIVSPPLAGAYFYRAVLAP